MNINKQRQLRQDFLMREGIFAKDGPTLVMVADVGSVLETDYQTIGCLAGDPTFNGGFSFNDIEVGFRKLNMAKVDKGMKPTLSLPMMALQPEALKLAFGTKSYTLVQPTTPITATVDTTTTPPTRLTVTLTATALFLKGQTVSIMTGTTNQQPEIRTIQSYNSTSKLLTFTQPLDRDPVDGATINVVEIERLIIGADRAADKKVRFITIHRDNSETIVTIPRATVSGDAFLNGGMDKGKQADIKLELLADITEVAGNLVTTYAVFETKFAVTQGQIDGTA